MRSLGVRRTASIANGATEDAFAAGVRDQKVAFTQGFHDAFLTGAGFAVAAAVLALLLISTRDSRDHAAAAQRGEVDLPAA